MTRPVASLILLLPLCLFWTAFCRAGEPVIAAAASLRDTLPALVDAFAGREGIRPRLSFGASGNLRRQIARGAPFELYLSADEGFVLDLVREGLTEGEGAVYALGRLAILARKDSAVRPAGGLKDLDAAIGDRRLAIANPEHAPYGLAAREALQRIGLWERLQPRLVVGENVSQAAQFAASGAAAAGIVAYSLVLSTRLAECCDHSPIPAELHEPLSQRGVLIRGAGEGARRFFAFLLGPVGRDILREHGFGLPGGTD